MTFKETMAKLFSTSEGTYYKWKRENRPIINLLEKYFTKEDIEEFLEFNSIEKFETLKHSNYAEIEKFFKLLDQIEKFIQFDYKGDYTIGIDYLAFIYANTDFEELDHFSIDNFIIHFVSKYDDFKKLNNDEVGFFDSNLLSDLIKVTKNYLPQKETIENMYFNDFFSAVKYSSKRIPSALNNAVRFCIMFNKYKYNIDLKYNDFLKKVYIPLQEEKIQIFPDGGKLDLDYQKFKEQVIALRNKE